MYDLEKHFALLDRIRKSKSGQNFPQSSHWLSAWIKASGLESWIPASFIVFR